MHNLVGPTMLDRFSLHIVAKGKSTDAACLSNAPHLTLSCPPGWERGAGAMVILHWAILEGF